MTLETTVSKAVYTGNGATTEFPFSFKVWEKDQILVSVTDAQGYVQETGEYSVALSAGGGTVSYLHEGAPLPMGWKLALTRDMPFTQEDDYITGTRFDPEVIETALDKATAERQQLLEQLQRAVILPPTSDETPEDMAHELLRARDDVQDMRDDVQGMLAEVGTEIGNHSIVTAEGGTAGRTLASRFADVVNVKDFGAVGDGVTDDTTAIQAALTVGKGKAVFFPSGKYIVTPQRKVVDTRGTTPETRWMCVDIFDGTSVFGSGEIVFVQDSSHLINGSAVVTLVFRLLGSDVSIDGLTFTSDFRLDRDVYEDFSRCLYFGSSVDPEMDSTGIYKNLSFNNLTFNGFFYGIAVQYSYDEAEHGHISGITLDNCRAYGLNRRLSGPYTFSAPGDDAGAIRNVTLSNCYAEDYHTSSSFNFVGVHGVNVVNCTSVRNAYAACEVENGCRDVNISNLVSINDLQGVWIDDSWGVNVNGVTFRSDKELDNILGISGVVRPAIYISRQGSKYIWNQGRVVGDIHISNVTSVNGRVFIGLFGEIPEGITPNAFGNISLSSSSFEMVAGSSEVKRGVFASLVGTETAIPSLSLSNVTVKNFNNDHYIFSGPSVVTLTGCKSFSDSDDVQSLTCASVDTKVVCTGCDFRTYPSVDTSKTVLIIGCFEQGVRIPDRLSSAIINLGSGKYPNGNVIAYSGSLWSQVDANKATLFLRNTPGTNSGWVALAENPCSKNFLPAGHNLYSLGSASFPWTEVYAVTGAIQTSDARKKDDVEPVSESLMRAWAKVNFKIFKFRDAIAKKGKEARLHVGVIAQQVEEAFASEGLDVYRYGLFCYNRWEDEYDTIEIVDSPEVRDEKTGEVVEPEKRHIEKVLTIKAGETFSIRYDEALALECAYQRWRLSRAGR